MTSPEVIASPRSPVQPEDGPTFGVRWDRGYDGVAYKLWWSGERFRSWVYAPDALDDDVVRTRLAFQAAELAAVDLDEEELDEGVAQVDLAADTDGTSWSGPSRFFEPIEGTTGPLPTVREAFAVASADLAARLDA